GEPQPLTGAVPARWRQLRGVGQLLLDPALRFVDVAHPDTLAEMRIHFASLAVDLGHRDVDLSTMTSGDRRLTQRVARYVYERTDAAGGTRLRGAAICLAARGGVGMLGALRGPAGRRAPDGGARTRG
ncbi:MAG TPA: hypothetical protein VIC60_08935, partial [Thermomicrobiales bacterium]